VGGLLWGFVEVAADIEAHFILVFGAHSSDHPPLLMQELRDVVFDAEDLIFDHLSFGIAQGGQLGVFDQGTG
jgi:hypothetical protein